MQDCGFANAQVCASQSDIQAAVDSFLHPDVTARRRARTTSALGIKPKAPKQRRDQAGEITTLVLNGTTIAGLARDTSYKLAQSRASTRCSCRRRSYADTPTPTYTANYVYYDSVQPNAQEAAQQLKTAMGPNTIVAPLPPQLATFAQQAGNPLAIVAVGTAFGGEIVNPQAHVVQVQPRQPPNVATTPARRSRPLSRCRAQGARSGSWCRT